MKKIYIPSNLDLKLDVTQHELDKYYYFIHLIYEQRVLYKNSSDYIPLKAEYLRKIIRGYNHYIEKLIELGIIDCDRHYIKGKKSFGYRLLAPYSEVKHKQLELTNKCIINNIEDWKKQRLPMTEVHQHLYGFLNKIDINYEPASTYINNFTIDEYNSSKIAIDKFQNKDFFLYTDDFGNRVHTNVTNLKSNLRKFLSYKNKKLINVDVINSQPLFLYLLLPLYTIRCTFDLSDDDVRLYKDKVQQGKLYDFLMEKAGVSDRKEFKETLFREIFFGRAVNKWFWDLFPSIAKVLANIKKEDYRKMAWMMQRAESDLIINKICRRIMEEHPTCFITTIHDSILTTEENAGLVEIIMKQEFDKLGLLPSIRIEAA